MPSKSARRPHQGQSLPSLDNSRWWCVIVLAVVIVFFAAIRFRLRTMPLERDEGEYAYAGQLFLQGIVPYKLAYNMKLPGTYAAYAFIMAIFGQSPSGIHLGMILVNAATVVLIFLLARRLFDSTAALTAACTFAVLSNSEAVLGFAGHATQFVVLVSLGGLLILLKALGTKRTSLYFFAGFLLGTAFVCKQPGIVFTIFGAVYLAFAERNALKTWTGIRHLSSYCAGAISPFILTCMVMLLGGELGRMWFWTFSYARQYAAVTRLREGWENLFVLGSSAVEVAPWLWILTALGIVALAWDSHLWKHAFFLLGLLMASLSGLCAGLYFRPHYLVLLLPIASLLAGLAISSAQQELRRLLNNAAATLIPATVFAIIVGVSIAAQADTLFRLDPTAVCREAYDKSPFPEAEVVSAYLNRQAGPEARIAVLGSEPEIYFYSRRHSATGYIYVYPLVEPQPYAETMQHEMVNEIETNRPEYIVLVKVTTSWQAHPGSSRFILDWSKNYLATNYRIVGVADEISPTETRYVWEEAAKTYTEKSDAVIEIFRRTSATTLTPVAGASP